MSRSQPSIVRFLSGLLILSMADCVATLRGQEANPIGAVEFSRSSQIDESSANREQSLLFVKEHHEELFRLLAVLKTMNPAEYEVALKDISKARKRLEPLEKRDKELYAIDLKGWQIQSRIDLLTARIVSNQADYDQSIEQLRTLVHDRVLNQKARIEIELKNLEEKKRQLSEAYSKLDGHEDEKTDQQWNAIKKRIENRSAKSKATK